MGAPRNNHTAGERLEDKPGVHTVDDHILDVIGRQFRDIAERYHKVHLGQAVLQGNGHDAAIGGREGKGGLRHGEQVRRIEPLLRALIGQDVKDRITDEAVVGHGDIKVIGPQGAIAGGGIGDGRFLVLPQQLLGGSLPGFPVLDDGVEEAERIVGARDLQVELVEFLAGHTGLGGAFHRNGETHLPGLYRLLALLLGAGEERQNQCERFHNE